MNWLWRLLGYDRRHWVIRRGLLYLETDHGIATTWTAAPKWRKKFYTYREALDALIEVQGFAVIEEVNP